MFKFTGILSILSDIAPLLLLLVFSSKLKSKKFLALFIWSIFSVLVDFSMIFFPSKIQSLTFLTVIAEPFFVIFILYWVVSSVKIKKFFIYAIFLLAGFAIFNLYNSNFNEFQKVPSVLIILFSLILVIVALTNLSRVSIETPILYIEDVFYCFGYMIYTSGILFLFATLDRFPNLFLDPGYGIVFLMANIIKNILLVIFILHNELMTGKIKIAGLGFLKKEVDFS